MSPTRRSFSLALLTLAAALGISGCAAEPEPTERAPRISRTSEAVIDGKVSPASQDEVVMLARLQLGRMYGVCTATLLAPNLALTARHCVSEHEDGECDSNGNAVTGSTAGANIPIKDLIILTGNEVDYETAPKMAAARVAKIITDGAKVTCNHDVALVVLDRPIPGAKLAPLRLEAPAKVGEVLTVVGWGRNEQGLPSTRRLTRPGIEVLRLGPIEQMGNAEFEVGESVCNGDSGGPALADSGAVVGVVSRGGNPLAKPDPTNDAALCIGKDTRVVYSALAPFKDLILAAYDEAGAKPWLEGQPPPGAKDLGEECSDSADCASGICFALGGAGFCTSECEATECAEGYTCQPRSGKQLCIPVNKARSATTPGANDASPSSTTVTASCSASGAGVPGPSSPLWFIGLALGFVWLLISQARRTEATTRRDRGNRRD